jgi:hypothetical protein
MKLSEALVLRADTQKRIQQLAQRLILSALVQEGEQPPENPQELLAELDRLVIQLRGIIASINRTNERATLPSGETITEALARRDTLDLHYQVLQAVAKHASTTGQRYSGRELRTIPTVDVAELRRQQDAIAQERRQVDTAIQATNWATDLVE